MQQIKKSVSLIELLHIVRPLYHSINNLSGNYNSTVHLPRLVTLKICASRHLKCIWMSEEVDWFSDRL